MREVRRCPLDRVQTITPNLRLASELYLPECTCRRVLRETARVDYFRVARQNEAARAADATACIDTSVGTALLKNGWRRR